MKIGTKSLLYGAHCFFIHPVFVAIAWIKLFGWPWDPRFWIAFFVHDLGYWGKPDMDGEEGETHPEVGARIMEWFDWKTVDYEYYVWDSGNRGIWWRYDTEGFNQLRKKGWMITCVTENITILERPVKKWVEFSKYHSKTYASKYGKEPSKLYAADKLAMALEPKWLYLLRVRLTGEISEYMEICSEKFIDQDEWYNWTSQLLRKKAYKYRNAISKSNFNFNN